MTTSPISPAQPRQTLEQQRAQDAWKKCEHYKKEHINITKALPALIMNSGLMQVLAFCHEKGNAYEKVAEDLRRWLAERFPVLPSDKFEDFMQALMETNPQDFQAIAAEAFAWLRWMRQMSAAAQVD